MLTKTKNLKKERESNVEAILGLAKKIKRT